MRYTIDAGVYNGKYFNFESALKLRNILKRAEIDSNIVPGGLGIYPSNHQEIHKMLAICNNYGIVGIKKRSSTFEENILFEKE